jgi:GT2 family glycosyltransferase
LKLSIVIVNYNVKHFLEQALHSVRNATRRLNAEVFVVDNHSADGSCEMVKRKFPEVKLIANTENVGFSKANNQAIRQSMGEYVLLLNPDTVVQEDTFDKVIAFMETHPEAGSLGVKMIDGKGHFLPESKRSLPTPDVAFYKMFGLASLFPKSKRFGKYHLGYLDKNKTHEVQVLSGAFMLLRASALEKTGLLDEDYFMYGEDIDLSYRITLAGYKNYYFADTTIIHYKGESTKRTSINYVFVFYKAMVIFANKHYSAKNARTFSLLIHFAIYIRAVLAIIARFATKLYKPLFDFGTLTAGLFITKELYEAYYRYREGGEYPENFVFYNLLVYAILFVAGLLLAGAYRKRSSLSTAAKGIAIGTLFIVAYYAFIPDIHRYSRGFVILATFCALAAIYLNRLIGYAIRYKKLNFGLSLELRTIIVGNELEVERVKHVLLHSKAKCEYIGYVGIEHNHQPQSDDYLGDVAELSDITELFGIEEIIFCAKDMAAQQIISWMSRMKQRDIQYKIVPEESLYIIGSNSKNTQGDFYTIELNFSLSKPTQLAKKRVLDVLISTLLATTAPFILPFVNNRFQFLKNIANVWMGKQSWVGYAHAANTANLPPLKKGILSPADIYEPQKTTAINLQKLNFLYAKDYTIDKDVQIVLYSLSKLGN